jgi:hypothetical protein
VVGEEGQLRLRDPDRPWARAGGENMEAERLGLPAKSPVATAAPFAGPESGGTETRMETGPRASARLHYHT